MVRSIVPVFDLGIDVYLMNIFKFCQRDWALTRLQPHKKGISIHVPALSIAVELLGVPLGDSSSN
jgi:hypothetical protein